MNTYSTDYPSRRRSQELSPSNEALWNTLHNQAIHHPNPQYHHSLHYPKNGNSRNHSKLSQATSIDDSNPPIMTSNLTMQNVNKMRTKNGFEIKPHDIQFNSGCEPSRFSNSHDEIAYRGGNVESAEILPIFHKLLEDKRSSHNELQNPQENMRRSLGCPEGKTTSMENSLTNATTSRDRTMEINGRRAHFSAASAKMRSCPDMSVRCDIVEYL